jgi:hypothetical protein
MVDSKSIGSTLLSRLYEIVTSGEKGAPSANSFVSWCMPGIPFEPEDFNFAIKGIGSGNDAEEARKIVQQAFTFSQLVDFIPNVSGVYNDGSCTHLTE